MPLRLLPPIVLAAAVCAPAAADVWDTAVPSDDTPASTRHELVPGYSEVHDLARRPNLLADVDWYRILQEPYSSYEILVDGGGGPTGPVLLRTDATGLVTLQSSVGVGTGPVRSLRWENATSQAVDTHRVQVRSATCLLDCTADDVYRVRAYETTYAISRFNNSGTQVTVLLIQNASDDVVSGTVHFWSPGGTRLGGAAFSLQPLAVSVINTGLVSGAGGVSGSATVTHDGRHGSLAGKSVALEPATGFSFSTPLDPVDAALTPRARAAAARPDTFRIDTLNLRDPHVFVPVAVVCNDVTDLMTLGFSINNLLSVQLTLDSDLDGLLDLSLLASFRPLVRTAPGGAPFDLQEARCTAPLLGTSCAPTPSGERFASVYANQEAGTCLAPLANTLSPANYVPAVATPAAPCFSTGEGELDVRILGQRVPLRGVRVAATYSGTPTSGLTSGLLMGFLTETDANTITVPVPLLPDFQLSQLLAGSAAGSCAPHSDRDTGPDPGGGTTTGWWFYFNYTASRVSASIQ